MTNEEAAHLRAQVQEATRVLSGAYTMPQARQVALTEEYAETFASAVERLLDEREQTREALRQEQREHANCEQFHDDVNLAQIQFAGILAQQNQQLREVVRTAADYPEYRDEDLQLTLLRMQARAVLSESERKPS